MICDLVPSKNVGKAPVVCSENCVGFSQRQIAVKVVDSQRSVSGILKKTKREWVSEGQIDCWEKDNKREDSIIIRKSKLL